MASMRKIFKLLFAVKHARILSAECNISEDGVTEVHLKCAPYKRFQYRCPFCHRRCPVYDGVTFNRTRVWRSLDAPGAKVYITADVPRIQCPEHGVHSMEVPWAIGLSRFTTEFDMTVAWLAKQLPRSVVGELMQIDWKTVGRCVARASERLEGNPLNRLKDLVDIGIDETSYTKGHNYITVVVNHRTNEVVWAHKGHDKETLSMFFELLTPEQRQAIRHVSGDGARWIDACLQIYVPQAVRCVDSFHVVQWSNEALESVRKQSWREAHRDFKRYSNKLPRKLGRHQTEMLAQIAQTNSTTADVARCKLDMQANAENAKSLSEKLRGAKYALGKAPENLSQHQQATLEYLALTNPKIFRAYKLKEEIRLAIKIQNVEEAALALKRWYFRATHSKLPEFVNLAKKIRRHEPHILNTIHTGLSNARVEAINRQIRLLINKARGFRNIDNLIKFVMLCCSSIQIPLPNHPSPHLRPC